MSKSYVLSFTHIIMKFNLLECLSLKKNERKEKKKEERERKKEELS